MKVDHDTRSRGGMVLDVDFTDRGRGRVLRSCLAITAALWLTLGHAQPEYATVVLDNPTPQADSFFGLAMSEVGDINGDGISDFVVGAPYQMVSSSVGYGRAFVFSGADQSLLLTLKPVYESLFFVFGYTVAGTGDVNEDGTPDILVQSYARNFFLPGIQVFPNRTYTFSGADQSELYYPPTWRISGFATPTTVAGVNDVNGDGKFDLLVGVPDQDVGDNDGQGQAFLVSGANGSFLRTFDVPMPRPGARFGSAVAGAGDVNGDGIPDLIVGAPGLTVAGNESQGQSFVFSGADGSLLHTLDHPMPQAGARFGSAAAGVGDVDGDGIPDFLVGAPQQDVGGNINQGRAFLMSGADGTLLRILDDPTPQAGGGFGWAVAGANDVNGDSEPDLLVAAPGQDVNGNRGQGRVFLFLSTRATP